MYFYLHKIFYFHIGQYWLWLIPLKVPEFDLPSCFNIVGGLGPDASLMDMLEVADDQLAFESGLIGNSDIKADYGGKMGK